MSDEVPTYRVVLHVTADSPPSEWLLNVIQSSLEGELESVSLIDFHKIVERPTNIEHHGGYQDIPERY